MSAIMSTRSSLARGDCGKAGGTAADGDAPLVNGRGVHAADLKGTAPAVRIEDGAGHLPVVRELIGEYVAWLGRDLAFQGIEEELAHLENKYLPPHGEVIVAVDSGCGTVLGMVAWTSLGKGRCELKRLYVRPEARGRNVATSLMEAIIERAKRAGFTEMVLDTLEGMVPARRLYAKFGFARCEAYYQNPMPDVVYMRRLL